MFARLVFVVALAQLLFNFFGHKVDGRVKIALPILGKQVRPRDGEPDGTTKLAFRQFQMIVFKRDAGAGHKPVHVLQLLNARENMILDGFGQSDVVGRQNELHATRMAQARRKIQMKEHKGRMLKKLTLAFSL